MVNIQTLIQRGKLMPDYEPQSVSKVWDRLPPIYLEYLIEIIQAYSGEIDTDTDEGKLNVISTIIGAQEVIQCANDHDCDDDEILVHLASWVQEAIPQTHQRVIDMARFYDLIPKLAIPALSAIDDYNIVSKYC